MHVRSWGVERARAISGGCDATARSRVHMVNRRVCKGRIANSWDLAHQERIRILAAARHLRSDYCHSRDIPRALNFLCARQIPPLGARTH